MIPAASEESWEALDRKVRFLSCASAYAGESRRIETIETHMSFVFLTDAFAYKMKKPVCLPFVDYTRLESRYQSCRGELSLNSTLAEDVYLDVVPLVEQDTGLVLGESRTRIEGRIVDWLLKMKRLPSEAMLDQQLNRGSIDELALQKAAIKLSRFYKDAPPADLSPELYISRLDAAIQENQRALTEPRYGFGQDEVQRLIEVQGALRQDYAKLLVQRVLEQKLVDGHGDLRPEHICLIDPPVLIDRLEVDPQARIIDPVDELSLLFVECQLPGHARVGEIFYDAYRSVTGDRFPDGLLRFYKSLRACMRAKFSAWHLDDDKVMDKERWRKRAAAYLAIASRCTQIDTQF